MGRRIAGAVAFPLALCASAALGPAGCQEEIRDNLRGLVHLGPEAQRLASWRAPADAIFPHLEEAARVAYPEASIATSPAEAAIRFWHRDAVMGPARATFRLAEGEDSGGAVVCSLLAYPLRTSVDPPPHDRRLPPTARLLEELRRRLETAGIEAVNVTDGSADGPPDAPPGKP
ncbi:MAG: hypothetical protein JXP34_14275 [Planctomycetes bacterium]|nr:hypothetical protein [Planctomycetota bacterium]